MVASVEERYKVTGEAHNWSDGGGQRFPGLDLSTGRLRPRYSSARAFPAPQPDHLACILLH